MRHFILALLIVLNLAVWGQTALPAIDWTLLPGKWECTKLTRIFKKKTEDLSDKKISYVCDYSTDLNFTLVTIGHPRNPATKTVVVGKYKIDKVKNLIIYTDVVQTISYTDGAYEDYVSKTSMMDIKVIKLTNDVLILFFNLPSGDMPGAYTTYFKKLK